jgi:hypothetical protein
MARSELCAKDEAGDQEELPETFAMAKAVDDAPAHACFFLTSPNAAARDDPIAVDEYEIAHAEGLEIIEKGREAIAFMRSEEGRNVGVERRKACLAIRDSIRAENHHGTTKRVQSG